MTGAHSNPLNAASPFGFTWNSEFSINGIETPTSVYSTIETQKPPLSHPDFISVSLHFLPQHGITHIEGRSTRIKYDANGTKTKELFFRIKDEIDALHGESQRVLNGIDSKVDDYTPWASVLYDNNKGLNAIWSDNTSCRLPEGIESIYLYAWAYDKETVQIFVEYTRTEHIQQDDYERANADRYYGDLFLNQFKKVQHTAFVKASLGVATGIAIAAMGITAKIVRKCGNLSSSPDIQYNVSSTRLGKSYSSSSD